MAQYVYSMHRVGKIVPPNRHILKDISLSFFPGAKIGVLGLNGAGKSTLLRIMAGVDTEIEGEARPQPGLKVGYLPQEPQLDESKDVRGNISICDNVQVTGYTMIVQDIKEPGVYSSGQPAQTNRDWRKNTVRLAKIGSLFDRVKALEKQV